MAHNFCHSYTCNRVQSQPPRGGAGSGRIRGAAGDCRAIERRAVVMFEERPANGAKAFIASAAAFAVPALTLVALAGCKREEPPVAIPSPAPATRPADTAPATRPAPPPEAPVVRTYIDVVLANHPTYPTT